MHEWGWKSQQRGYETFFKDVLSMIISEEENMISDLHEKLSDFVTAPSNLWSSSLKSSILPYVSGHAVTNIMKNKSIKCDACQNAISIGIHISDGDK